MKLHTMRVLDIASVITASCILIFLFIYPGIRLRSLKTSILPACGRIIKSVKKNDWQNALADANEISLLFDRHESALMTFLDHEDIDSVQDSINTLVLMCEIKEGPMAIVEAENISNIMEYIAGIESFRFCNLM